MSAPKRLEPGTLLKIGGPVDYDWASIAPRLTGDEYLGCALNTGPLNLLAAAVHTAKAEAPTHKRPPRLSQLCAYEFPGHGTRWFYVSQRVASMLGVLSKRSPTSRWCTLHLGCDGRSQVAVLRWIGVHVVTRLLEPVNLKSTDAPLCEYELVGRAAVGAEAFAMTRKGEAAPLADILPTAEVCALYRNEQILTALERRITTARHEADWLGTRKRRTEPETPAQGELDL